MSLVSTAPLDLIFVSKSFFLSLTSCTSFYTTEPLAHRTCDAHGYWEGNWTNYRPCLEEMYIPEVSSHLNTWAPFHKACFLFCYTKKRSVLFQKYRIKHFTQPNNFPDTRKRLLVLKIAVVNCCGSISRRKHKPDTT